ncbi:proline-rich transmembrane protein 1-like [Kryptolebias marmoratus]|uniref:proline-rich transmembrane protein 1-like n=1 Tax=Kryptolebias marmoratus TaxID=37003 RepID=UPI0007F9212A|nr:proline-rich transmembrane protein 1-like [Kryptolebias marmoratus]
MDPKQMASAPPGWTEEKAHMGQSSLPPPYQTSPYQGPLHPNTAYPPQPQDFGALPQYGMRYDQQYSPQPGIVTVQPVVAVTRAPLEYPVNDYLGYSIFTLLCCCLPLGIAALIHSISVRDANARGDRTAAEQNSRTARILNHVALAFGLLAFISSIIIVVVTITGMY